MNLSQCTFWCSVLSDASALHLESQLLLSSQCTFWCSVLSDRVDRHGRVPVCPQSQCTFWCSVLSDPFQRKGYGALQIFGLNAPFGAQCFPTRIDASRQRAYDLSQCTFWCSVLSDLNVKMNEIMPYYVSMHLLVLSAFRQEEQELNKLEKGRLNAPFGAQCFPTTRGTS